MVEGFSIFMEHMGLDVKNLVQKPCFNHLVRASFCVKFTSFQQNNVVGILQGKVQVVEYHDDGLSLASRPMKSTAIDATQLQSAGNAMMQTANMAAILHHWGTRGSLQTCSRTRPQARAQITPVWLKMPLRRGTGSRPKQNVYGI